MTNSISNTALQNYYARHIKNEAQFIFDCIKNILDSFDNDLIPYLETQVEWAELHIVFLRKHLNNLKEIKGKK